MKVLVINLAKATERKQFQKRQLAHLKLDFEFIPAIEASQARQLRSESYWRTGQSPLRDVEKACLLSHTNCWQKVADKDRPMLILEDDILLSETVTEFLKSFPRGLEMDVLNLETRDRRILLGKPIKNYPDLRPLHLNRDGAAAYILWPTGAKKLLKQVKKTAGLADAIIWGNFSLKSYQACPALALQSDRCTNYNLPSFLETTSSISIRRENSNMKYMGTLDYMKFRTRRILGQVHLAKPQLRYLLSAHKQRLPIRNEDFQYLKDVKNGHGK